MGCLSDHLPSATQNNFDPQNRTNPEDSVTLVLCDLVGEEARRRLHG
jgi:hypothetical protein